MKKVLIIGPFPSPISGVSLANDTLFNGLKSEGIRVNNINFSYPTLKENIGKFSFKKVFYYLRLYFYIFKIPNYKTIYMTPGQTFFGILKYYPFIFISKVLRKEILIHVHGNHLWKEYENLNGYKKRIFYHIISKFNKGIVLSPKLRKNLTPFIRDEYIYEVYNFIEDNILNDISAEDIKSKKTDELNIVFLSNLMKEKGIFDFLNSIIILKKKGVKFKAKIAGAVDKTSENELNELFNKLKDDVEYLGVVRGNDKRNLLLNSNVFVFPTYYSMEGQPISILEAMGTGNIILTTNHAGISDIFVENKNGFFIEKTNPNDIASKLERLSNTLGDHKKIMINNNLEANEKYSTNRFISNIIEIIER